MPVGDALTQRHHRERGYVHGEVSGVRGASVVASDGDQQAGDRVVWLLAAAMAALVIGWALAVLTVEEARIAVLSSRARVGLEVAAALARLFAALVLLLFPAGKAGERLRWVGGGLVILGLGSLVFGYFGSLLGETANPNRQMYAAIGVQCIACTLFTMGLVPATPRPFSARSMLVALNAFAVVGVIVVVGEDVLPRLENLTNLELAIASAETPPPGLTGWHWALAILPLALGILAVVGAVRHYPGQTLGGWLVVAMVLWAGTQLHNLLWPSTYVPVVTTATVLRAAFALVLVVGGYLELRRIAEQRAESLAVEREYAQRLGELAVLKADFTAVVAHELGSPIAAIGAYADMLALEDLPADDRAMTIAAIRSQVQALNALVADVRTAATAERDDFAVAVRPVPVAALLADAAAFARTILGDHSFTVAAAPPGRVWADRERIGQVLRNLIDNAAKYTPASTAIEVRAVREGGHVRIEVADHGQGIQPDDLVRIFEKFGRGRDQHGQSVPGTGLGLYLSRRIVQAHGADLTVESTPGDGSVFGFLLEVVR